MADVDVTADMTCGQLSQNTGDLPALTPEAGMAGKGRDSSEHRYMILDGTLDLR